MTLKLNPEVKLREKFFKKNKPINRIKHSFDILLIYSNLQML